MASNQKSEDNPHVGHRDRMRERFFKNGFNGFSEHEILEFMLFFIYKRGNTNEIAHRLLQKFGSLNRVLKADRYALMDVNGVGEQSALLINSMKEFFRRTLEEKAEGSCLMEIDDRCQYFLDLLLLETDELFLLSCLDDCMRVINTSVVARGTPGSVHFDKINVMHAIVSAKCNAVMIAHNHPNGVPMPSYSDIDTTRILYESLKVFGIDLVDHIIVGDGRAVSMKDSGSFIQI